MCRCGCRKKFTETNVLSIATFWYKETSWQRKFVDSMGSLSIYGGLDNIDQRFISECYDIEGEAISVLASLNIEMERAFIPRSLPTNFDEQEEDDNLLEEIMRLEESKQLLKEDLS